MFLNCGQKQNEVDLDLLKQKSILLLAKKALAVCMIWCCIVNGKYCDH